MEARRGRGSEGEARELLRRLRIGALRRDQLLLAAHLGYPPARLLRPEAKAASMEQWLGFFRGFQEPARLTGRVALALAEHLFDESPGLRSFDPDLPRAVAALAAWVEGRAAAQEVQAAAEAARETAAGLEWMSFNAGPGNRLPNPTDAAIIAECARVPEEWAGLAWALQLAAIRLGQSYEPNDPPHEPLLREIGLRLGSWALEARPALSSDEAQA